MLSFLGGSSDHEVPLRMELLADHSECSVVIPPVIRGGGRGGGPWNLVVCHAHTHSHTHTQTHTHTSHKHTQTNTYTHSNTRAHARTNKQTHPPAKLTCLLSPPATALWHTHTHIHTRPPNQPPSPPTTPPPNQADVVFAFVPLPQLYGGEQPGAGAEGEDRVSAVTGEPRLLQQGLVIWPSPSHPPRSRFFLPSFLPVVTSSQVLPPPSGHCRYFG